eukprot:XP_011667042.1 PREDICTED: apoptotic protease-activating factor 1 [Strongylocentrotus purpuratus]
MSAISDCYGNQLSALRLHELSEHLHPDDYRRLGLTLGLEEIRLTNLESAKCGNIQECIYQVLVDWTKRNGRGATSQVLLQSLKQIGNQAAADWLQAEIESSLSIAPQEDIDSICRRGNVPSLPDCLTERSVEIADVTNKLRELSSLSSSSTSPSASTTVTRWLVVHGLGGMGKSVLINQAIRDEQLIKEYFPDGVYWLPIGAAVRGTACITERLETLCRSLDVKLLMAPSLPKTKDQWKNLLSTLIAQTYPRSLLVLDDVWDQDVIGAFEVCSTVVVTTRDKGLHSCALGRKEEIVLFEGFSEPQSLQALSEWTMTSPSDLPPQAAHIHQLSHGSPLVISIIGSLLREHGHRWEYYVTQLEEKNLKKLSTARDAIHLSVEELPSRDEVMRLFSWFAVFDQGTRLSSKILSMLEGCSTEEIEDRMKILTQRHLAISGCHSDDKDQIFWLHDLVYDYLVSEKVANDKDVGMSNEFRSLMVFNRFRACRRDMIQTSLCLPQVSEVHRRAKAASAARASKNGFYVAEVVDKRTLLSSVTHSPAGKYATCAKLLPSGKEILTAGYGGQVQIVDIIEGKARMLIHGHADNVTDLSVSSDGSLLATCSPTKGVCIWDFSRTDCILPHVKNITCEDSDLIRCSFVECNGETKLVTGDTSGFLKVWDTSFSLQYSIQVGNTSLMQANSSDTALLPGSAILACSTCDKNGLVASCAKADNIVRVFNLQTGSQKFAIVHDTDVRDCSFLSNGLIVTLTWCLLSVYNTRGRQLSRWTDRDGNVNFCNLSCAQGKDGYYIAVQGSTGSITVLHLGKMFPVTNRLTEYYRLNVGGVYRDIINMWMECINDGNGACGNYLVTNQSCGLILVWKFEKGSRPQIDGSTFGISFKTDGSIRALVGKNQRNSRKCSMLHCCGQNVIANKARTIYKTKEFETIDMIEISQDHPHDIISCTSSQVKVTPLPRCVTRKSNRKDDSTTLKEFSIVPSQDKIILAKLIDSHHLLTVSSGTQLAVECWSRSGSSTGSRHIAFQQALSADLSHDHRKLAVGCSNSTVLVLKLNGCKIDDCDPTMLEVDGFRVTRCVFSPNDKLLAVSGDRKVTVFDIECRTQLAKSSHKTTISSIRFTPDSEMLFLVVGGSIMLCESHTLCKRSKHTVYAEVSDYHFSADGTMLVTAGAVKHFDKGYLEWWRIDTKSGAISQLQKFMINNRIKRVVCNQYFTVFVTVDEVDEIYVLQRIAPSEGHDNGN